MAQEMLAERLRQNVMAYLDDVIIYSDSYKEHCQHVRRVLEWFHLNELKCEAKKCRFVKRKLNFLGREVGPGGNTAQPQHLHQVAEFPAPANASSCAPADNRAASARFK